MKALERLVSDEALESGMCDVIKIHLKRSGKGNQPLNIKTAVERPISKQGLPNFILFYFSLHPSIFDVFLWRHTGNILALRLRMMCKHNQLVSAWEKKNIPTYWKRPSLFFVLNSYHILCTVTCHLYLFNKTIYAMMHVSN